MLNDKLKDLLSNTISNFENNNSVISAIKYSFYNYLISNVDQNKIYISELFLDLPVPAILSLFVELTETLSLNNFCYMKGFLDENYLSLNNNSLLKIHYSLHDKDYAYVYIHFCTNSLSGHNILNHIYEKYHLISEKQESNLYTISENKEELSLHNLGLLRHPLIFDNYNDLVVKEYNYIYSELLKNKPNGRLIILNGLPGSGKTHFIYGLMDLLRDDIFVYLPPFMVEGLSSPKAIKFLYDTRLSHKKTINLVIEDADAILITRGLDNLNAINVLLNLTDGFLADSLNIRIIATTNQKKIDFDSAIIRKNRLCKIVNFDKLPIGQSNKVYQRLTKTDNNQFNTSQVLADIYHAASQI